MASATPAADEAMPQTEKDSQIAGSPDTNVAMDSIPRDQLRMIAEHIENPGKGYEPGGVSAQSNMKVAEEQAQNGVDSQNDKASAKESIPEMASVDSSGISPDMEKYRRMEAFLLKHRKEWESTKSPAIWGTLQPHSLPRRDKRVEFGPWSMEWTYDSVPRYQRPNPFELTFEHAAFPLPQGREVKDEFDKAIDYSAARNRIRQNFEWDMDRLFLLEEVGARKQKREAKATARAGLHKTGKPNAATKHGSHAQAEHGSDAGPDKETGLDLKLNYVQWFTFKRLAQISEGEHCVIDVLVGDPVIDIDTKSIFTHRIRRFNKPRHSDLGKTLVKGQAPLPERIRIKSEVLKSILAGMLSVDTNNLGDESFVLVRPFKSLFHCYDNLRSAVKKLEEKFATNQESIDPLNDDAESPDDVHARQVDTKDQEKHSTVVKDGSSHDSESNHGPITAQDHAKTHDGEVEDFASEAGDEDHEQAEEDDPHDPNQTETALQHLKILLEFMDSEIAAKITYLQTNECKKVFFPDLWYLFRPGQVVISRDGNQAYRVIQVSSPRHRNAQPLDLWLWYNSQDTQKTKKKGLFSMTCVYVDFDGSRIGPVSKTVDFKQFDGQADITSLPVYPIRLHPLRKDDVSDTDWKDLESLAPEKRYRQHLINRGTMFLKVLGIKPMYYAGPTLGVRDDIESQVVIDFETAFSGDDEKKQQWKPTLEMLIGEPVSEEDDTEFDGDCTGECCRYDNVYDDNYIDSKETSRYVNSLLPSSDGTNTQPSIAVFPQLLKDLKNDASRTGYSISDDELVIMSHRVFGFVLRQRQWAELDLSYLTELYAHRQPLQGPQAQDGSSVVGEVKTAFDNLVLEEKQKPMIQALVAQHFRDKEHKAGQAAQMDIVKGKGKGLILLLHGAPGVGKTSTAGKIDLIPLVRCIMNLADNIQRELPSCSTDHCSKSHASADSREGDLGTTAKEVERALDINFTLANRWDCILLLDEADVFLAQRNKEDFQRNGLVAVFLRVLEYYAGVLFLTTNRVGDFDEAFTSRIHVSLYYPDLDCDKTIKIFDINIEMIRSRFKDKGRNIVVDDIESFAKNHYEENKDARWNGRQIRNACQTALALAEFEAQGNSHTAVLKPDAVVHLKLSHFETVQQAYLAFTRYMNSVYGSTTETRAQEGKVRAILGLMNEGTAGTATSHATVKSKKEAFRNAARARSDPAQQPTTPSMQPATPQQQTMTPGQPVFQPMYASGNQQYVNASVAPQGYYQNQMYPQYVQQPMVMPQMQQQQLAVPSQQMQLMQPQAQQPQAQSMMTPNAPQAWNSPGPTPENAMTQQPGAVPEAFPHTPPSQSRQVTYPQQQQTTGADSPLFRRSIQDMYSAGSPQTTGAGYPQQQQQQQQQTGGGGGPPPSGQIGGAFGTVQPGATPSNQGQWPGPSGLQSMGGIGQ
ncbi:hypothetical protein PG985_014610 [Apiospora marii]|uniref:AAA+ ATPase domain-containing protein n=1 Tax=Apiospora marii TaxID=335849 RepID=A0ABR1R4H7_9PEZI